MNIWRKTAERASSGRGLARAILDGVSREELLHEAQIALARQGQATRIGVWFEARSNGSPQDELVAGFHGTVWDRGNRDPPP
jgi:hypothetical protein